MSEEKDSDFTICPDCSCDEALIIAVGHKENKGKLQVFCPVCEQFKVIKEDETEEHKKLWRVK